MRFCNGVDAVPSLWRDRGGRSPLQAACAPYFWLTYNTIFGTQGNDKTTDNDEKITMESKQRNGYVQT